MKFPARLKISCELGSQVREENGTLIRVLIKGLSPNQAIFSTAPVEMNY